MESRQRKVTRKDVAEEAGVSETIVSYVLNKNRYVKEEKRLHDMLACHEGVAYINGEDTFCEYDTVKPYSEGLCGTMTKWGSTKTRTTPYREVLAAVSYKKS